MSWTIVLPAARSHKRTVLSCEGQRSAHEETHHRAGDDLRIAVLTLDGRDGRGVTAQDVHVRLGPHVPHARDGIATGGDEHVERRMQVERIDAGQVTVILPNDLVDFQVP